MHGAVRQVYDRRVRNHCHEASSAKRDTLVVQRAGGAHEVAAENSSKPENTQALRRHLTSPIRG